MFKNATGRIEYPFTNDYMFRAILQRNKKVLTGLLCSLLDLQESEITSVEITNPVVIGETIDAKTFYLDINICLNSGIFINLEMQVVNQSNWTDRSLDYLCRSFDQLYKGEDYSKTNRAIQIGILNFPLFPKSPEFYARYRLQNIKNHMIFNDKFHLNVLCLPYTDIATDEDVASGLKYWAELFRARTWEELFMLAEKNEYIAEAAEALYVANSEDLIRKQCEAREDALRQERYTQNLIKELQAEKSEALAKVDKMSAEKSEALAKIDEALAEKNEALAEKDEALAEKNEALAEIKLLRARIKELEDMQNT